MERNVSGNREVRDRTMADNLRWAMEFEGPGTKAVLWAHNGHVTRTQDDGEGLLFVERTPPARPNRQP